MRRWTAPSTRPSTTAMARASASGRAAAAPRWAAPVALILLVGGVPCCDRGGGAAAEHAPRPDAAAARDAGAADAATAAAPPPGIDEELEARADPALDFLTEIPDEAAWRRLAAASDEHAVARTEVVKIVLDLSDGELYFCQSDRWPIHHDFARRFLSSPERPVTEDRGAFNRANYLRPDRRFVMGSLVRYLDPGIWALELGPADTLPGPRVVDLMARLRPRVFFGEALRYQPRSDLHRRLVAPVAGELPIVESDEVMAGVRYQPLTLGVAFGFLRLVPGELDLSTVARSQVLVTREVPDDLPLSAALVTSDLQTPLAHVAVLSQSRGSPDMALRGALEDPRIRALEGRLVRLEVRPRGFTLAAASEAEAEAAWAAARPAAPTLPRLDLSARDLVDLCDVGLGDLERVGAKAAQLGEACGLGPEVVVPGGFVVPFAWYGDHARPFEAEIEAMLADERFRGDLGERHRRLGELRRRLEEAEVAPELLGLLRERIGRLPRGRLILRSSTNSEDLPGFSGAGLYRSVRLDAGASDEELATALRQVWASVWTARAFEERDFFRVDHRRVAMAVLVQPFVEDLVAIGVAITTNPFGRARRGSFINVQPAGGSVTATGPDVPEQVLAYDHSLPEVLSRSSRAGGRPVLTRQDVRAIQVVLRRLHDHFVPLWPGADAVDVELLLDRSRRPVVLQARPYRVARPGGG